MDRPPQYSPEVPPARHPAEIDVFELKRRIDAGERISVVDVREANELSVCALPGATHLPLSQFEGQWRDVLGGREDQELVVMCHHGVRSARATAYLLQQGFACPRSLAGGIHAWALAIDPAMTRY